ncbi:MAG TPA: type I-U CRISPR-associated protein Csb2 [Streptosporangiaceae bacterium]|nr:type I-U CRISPR-associated protein Csb2 [Streptosporangiaceae bacterium]
MFAIAVDLLCDRYTATHFNDRAKPEWPPHPARLFSAMVAAWADSDDPDPAERSALRWLEGQPPPAIRSGQAYARQVVTHFVPVNDATALTRDTSRSYDAVTEAIGVLQKAEESGEERAIRRAGAALAKAEAAAVTDSARAGQPSGRESGTVTAAVLEVLPENRGKQARTYPTVIPDETTVYFCWPDADADALHVRVLDGLLSRVGRIGHSSTFVACRSVEEVPPATWVPARRSTGLRLRVPRRGLIDRLEEEFAVHGGEEPRTLPAAMLDYERAGALQSPLRSPLLGGDWYLLGIAGRALPSAVRTLAAARATRNALLSHADQPPAEILSGHRAGSTTPLDKPHLAVVPLLNAGSPYSDGALFGVALVLPADCPDSDRHAVESALRTWSAAGFTLRLPAGPGGRPVLLTMEDLGLDRAVSTSAWLDAALSSRRKTVTRDHWCLPARRWLTVTPIALDRFPGNLRSRDSVARERAEAEAAASVARACVFAGLVDKADEVQVDVRLDAPLTGMPASPSDRGHSGGRYFAKYQTGDGVPRACVHAEIVFSEKVRGPVLIGAGRYLGYGLCLPREPRSAEEAS